MCWLLRTEEDYRLCYGEPSYNYVVTGCGTYFDAEQYAELVAEEREVALHAALDADNFPQEGWADVCNNDLGIIVSSTVAEYMLQGKELEVDQWVELEVVG